MNIPSYVDRIQAKFGDNLARLNELINNGILHGNFTENARGYQVIRIDLEEWTSEELQDYLKEAYQKQNWDLDFKRDLDPDDHLFWIDIHKTN